MIKKIKNLHIQETKIDENQYSYYFYFKYPIEKGSVHKTISNRECNIFLSQDGKVIGFDLPIHTINQNIILENLGHHCSIENDSIQIRLSKVTPSTKIIKSIINIDLDKLENYLGIEIP